MPSRLAGHFRRRFVVIGDLLLRSRDPSVGCIQGAIRPDLRLGYSPGHRGAELNMLGSFAGQIGRGEFLLAGLLQGRLHVAFDTENVGYDGVHHVERRVPSLSPEGRSDRHDQAAHEGDP